MRTYKVIFSTIKSMSISKMLKLSRAVLPHPVFSVLSFYATVKAYSIAQRLYPKTASTNGEGNAFRHAFWCCLILMYCSKVSSPQKALEFCKKITDLHEELFPNKPLETKMDLHNNKIGMNYFMQLLPGIHRQFFEKSFFIDELKKKTENAKILRNLDDHFEGELVYLDEK
ncbi:hypothetical protein ASG01_05385 [Chryseobacterium sp. Leaf180]|uniref:DUF6973 domain-containing protein n=1 Tax=Chryseobacterium sp. Leaf180 TaxID=1736289 RepID=UPI0006F8DE26|nr:hypothetical protein [Chryseobacterium sp. Leaf180]KQR95280.1 hypothetical protein ASG01_05385 [Chryseobacterium sp. Leaf180]